MNTNIYRPNIGDDKYFEFSLSDGTNLLHYSAKKNGVSYANVIKMYERVGFNKDEFGKCFTRDEILEGLRWLLELIRGYGSHIWRAKKIEMFIESAVLPASPDATFYLYIGANY